MLSKNILVKVALAVFLVSITQTACTDDTPPPTANTSTTPIKLTGTPTDDAHPGTSPTPIETPTSHTPTTTPDHKPPAHRQNAQYTLTASLDYGRHHLTVDEEITYFNNSSDELSELIMMVETNRYPGTFVLTKLSLEDDQIVDDYALENNQLLIKLEKELLPGDSIELALSYELNLPSPTPSPDIRPIPFGYTARQANLVDWYPYIPPYISGEGWLAHKPGYFGEHQVYEISDFQVNIRLSDNRSDLTVAASAPAELDGEWHRYRHLNARNFTWSVSHAYVVLTKTVGDVTVMSYSFPFDRTAGEAVLQTTVEALELYQELFGPYSRSLLSAVEADFLDGMEFDGLYFLSNGFYNSYQGVKSDYLIAIAAHETAHQWWYARVGNDQALEPWLDEAACTYSERLYYEHLYPEAMDWWWQYRIYYYQPEGKVNRSIYEPGGYLPYRDAVYLNGALFFEELRQTIGDTDFYAFLEDYAAQQAYQIASAADFFSLLRQHTSVDLSQLIEKYFN